MSTVHGPYGMRGSTSKFRTKGLGGGTHHGFSPIEVPCLGVPEFQAYSHTGGKWRQKRSSLVVPLTLLHNNHLSGACGGSLSGGISSSLPAFPG